MEQNEKGKGEIKEAETGAGRGPEESPETLEPREKRTKAEAAPPGHLPSLGNLKNLLEETNKAVAVAKMTNQEIDELVTKHQETERRLRQAEQLRKKRIARVESFDPLRKAEPSDYDLLLREGIIDDFAKLHGAESPKIAKETLQTLDKTIAEISAIKHPPPEIKTRLSELSEVRSAYHREIDGLIRQRQEEIGQRREKVKAKVIAHYAKRVEELNKLIAEIESNPKVAERLQALREQKKKEAEAREKALREEILSDCERYTQSVLARQNSAFERLAEVYRQIQAQEGAGMKEIKRRLTEITSWEISADNLRELARLMTDFRRRRQAAGGSEMSAEEKKEEQMIKSRLAKIRKLVETSIVDGEGKWRINHLAEIMPWEVTRSSIMYSDAISELSDAYNKEALRKLAAEGNKRAAIALENMEAATINNSLLREIYGKYRVYDKKTGELLLGWAWQVMEERRVELMMPWELPAAGGKKGKWQKDMKKNLIRRRPRLSNAAVL